MSHVSARDFGKRCCEHLEAGGHTAAHIIPSFFPVDNTHGEASWLLLPPPSAHSTLQIAYSFRLAAFSFVCSLPTVLAHGLTAEEQQPGLPWLRPSLDQRMGYKTDLLQPEAYRSHTFTTTEINEGLACKKLRRVRRCSSTLRVSDNIGGTVLFSDMSHLPV